MICANMIAFGRSAKSSVPYSARLEYIESTGTQWIVLPYTPAMYDLELKTTFDYQLTNISERQTSGSPASYIEFCTASGTVGGVSADLKRHTLVANGFGSPRMSLDGTSISNGGFVGSTDTSHLFSIGNLRSDIILLPCYWKLYSIKVENKEGNVVNNLIPVLDKVGVACMYDEVSGKFFYNQGTGEFVAGPIVERIFYTARDYIQDGLIAMWDGIDASVNTVTFSSTDGVEFDGYFGLRNNAASNKYISITDVANIEEAYKSGEFTFETVIDFATYTNTFVRIEPAPYKLQCFGYEPYIQLRDSFIGPTTSVNTPLGITSLKAKSSSTKNWQTQINTTIRSTTIADDIDFSQAEITRINCGLSPSSAIGAYRFYNRPLTDEEIAYNYNIDKQRFNLP